MQVSNAELTEADKEPSLHEVFLEWAENAQFFLVVCTLPIMVIMKEQAVKLTCSEECAQMVQKWESFRTNHCLKHH
jgi:hypothetical protein